jgi:hypothetical protein
MLVRISDYTARSQSDLKVANMKSTRRLHFGRSRRTLFVTRVFYVSLAFLIGATGL